jgi:phosphoenolpyruvate---glycerone phosphotransferase subunit DhaL
MITRDQIIRWIEFCADVFEDNKKYLTELDAKIGDADHGINMDRGFKKVLTLLPTVKNNDIGSILKTVGMALVSSVGGASGPLYGTFFLEAAKPLSEKIELGGPDLVLLFESGLIGIIRIGKANPGDKTMVDALIPGITTLKQKLDEGSSLEKSLEFMVKETREGLEATIPMIAKKGRASYLGERAVGHQDPGATSAYFMVKALFDAVTY